MLSGARSFDSAFVRARPAARLTKVAIERAGGALAAVLRTLTIPTSPRVAQGRPARTDQAEGREERSIQVRPPGGVVRGVEGVGGRRAGVVDEDVEPAETLERRLDESLEVRGVGHVDGEVEDVPARLPGRSATACRGSGRRAQMATRGPSSPVGRPWRGPGPRSRR
jgi:hypothetical protein